MQEVPFDAKYYYIPKVMTTAAHDKLLIEPDNNAITEWVTVSLRGLFLNFSSSFYKYIPNYRPLSSMRAWTASFGNTILAGKRDSRRHSTDNEYDIFSALIIAHAKTSVILAGQSESRLHSTTIFSENIVVVGSSYQSNKSTNEFRAVLQITRATKKRNWNWFCNWLLSFAVIGQSRCYGFWLLCLLHSVIALFAVTTFFHVCFQSVDKEKFEVCLKDMQPYDARHDAVTINLMVIGRE